MAQSLVETIRRSQADMPWAPYKAFMTRNPGTEHPESEPGRVMARRWKWRDGFPEVSLVPPIDWDGVCLSNRSWQWNLQAWDGLGPVLAAYERRRDPCYLRFAVDLALDWIAIHPAVGSGGSLAWADAAVGLRTFRLAYVLDAAAREGYQDTDLGPLVESAMVHATTLADPATFTSHTNHGFYQIVGQLALATRVPVLPGMDDAYRQGVTRFRELLSRHFTTEGVHKEHSPDYHYIVFLILEGALAPFVERDPVLCSMRSRLEEALAWFVLPNQRIAMFGDSSHRLMVRAKGGHEHPHLRFVFSGGKGGTAPAERLRAFPESGYVVMRDRWPQDGEDFKNCSYIAQACAFHSRTHKHADDLTFVWYDGRHELLVDAGRYGYGERSPVGSDLSDAGFWYSDPKRNFVESTRAHNTVEIDGRSYRRRGVTPYGSAVDAWGDDGDVMYVESGVKHDDVMHRRILAFCPGEWLLVLDDLESANGQVHHMAQRFNFAPELEVQADGENVRVSVPDKADPLHVVSLLPGRLDGPHRGVEDPQLLGWISREDRALIPTSTIAYTVADVAKYSFATLFVFAPDPPTAIQVESPTNVTRDGASFAWEASRGHQGLRLGPSGGARVQRVSGLD